jgi:hypothetical protein
MIDTKRAYDRAAEAWHTHALECPTCTLRGSERCDDGERLLRSENEAWSAYRNRVAVDRVQVAVDLMRGPRKG